MSLALPASDSPVRALIDMEQVASLGDAANVSRLPSFPDALVRSRAVLAAEPAAREVHTLALSTDGELFLLGVTRTGSRPVWNFGRI